MLVSSGKAERPTAYVVVVQTSNEQLDTISCQATKVVAPSFFPAIYYRVCPICDAQMMGMELGVGSSVPQSPETLE